MAHARFIALSILFFLALVVAPSRSCVRCLCNVLSPPSTLTLPPRTSALHPKLSRTDFATPTFPELHETSIIRRDRRLPSPKKPYTNAMLPHRPSLALSASPKGPESDRSPLPPPPPEESPAPPSAVSSLALLSLKFYKSVLSPLLPPSCRFLPTCSAYSSQAFRELGAEKAAVLTAWRLFRCAPWGGRGYDPPRWPPVRLREGSY